MPVYPGENCPCDERTVPDRSDEAEKMFDVGADAVAVCGRSVPTDTARADDGARAR